MFGEPIFQDTEETIADLQAITKQSVTNNSVSEALSKPYVTTVIGNMSLDEAGDDLTDFSGLILQRNESTGVASMDGYMGGQRQARFSSDGAISSGVVTYYSPRSSDPTALTEAGDSVVMDRDGFHTRSWHLYPQTSPQFAYSDGYWVEETRIGVDGEISAGAGSVVLGHDGLTNYDSEGEPAYTLDDDGLKYKGQPIINSENGKIQLKVDGAAIDGNFRAISITLPYVQIDNEGLRTFSKYYWDTDEEQYEYYVGDLQCSVGTNGVITAGAGAVKLDQYGLSTWIWTSDDVKYTDVTGAYNYAPPQYDEQGVLIKGGAIRQCAVTTNGELIAGANLYKLDVNGLSFNKTPLNTINPSWVRLLYYNQAENQIELPQDIHVTNATIDNLSADKITSGTLRATTAITCAGTISTGNGSVVMGNTSLSTYDVSVPSTPVLQCSIGADGVITAGTTKISNSGLITYYNNAVSAVISNQGRVAIGGGGQQSISIDGGLIKFYGTGSTIATDGTVSGTLGAYITSDGTINGLATNSVHTTQIEDNAVTDAKINTLSAGKIRTGELAVDVELKLTNTGSALLAGPAQTTGGTNYWKVRLDNNGLTTYTQGSTSTSVVPVCSIGADGNINGVKVEATNVKAGTLSSGVIYAGNITANQINTGTLDTTNVTVGNGSVVINSQGLTTYDVSVSPKTEQCSVGTNGAIIAGSNLVTLNERGITVGSASSTAPTILSLNNQSLFTISDTSNLPSVCISDSNSSFKNNVAFKNDISVADEIYIGDNMGKFAPRDLTVSVTARSGSTVISGTDTYNSIVISPQSQDTLVGPTTLHARIPSYIGVPTITTEHLDAYTPSSASQATDRIMGTSSGNISLQWATSKRDQPHYNLDWGAGITLNNDNAEYGFKTEPTSNWTESYLAITLDSNYPTTGTLYTVSYENSKYVYRAKANALYTKSGTTYTVVPENTELNTYTTYYAKHYDLTVASVLKIDIPISWTATSSDGGVLNEVIQVELEYQTRDYTARYTPYEGITNSVPGSYDTKTVTATLITSTSAGSDTLHFELKNPISLVNEVLSGTVVLSLLHMDIKATLPLSHTISIGAFSVSSLANITGNELIVSNGGIWGSTVIPAPDGSGGLNFLNYGSAPIANTTYVSSYVNSYSTSSSTMGLKRVIVLPSGDSLPTYGRDGDICIFVAR